jgi:phosphoribosylformylglycinamidine synthase
MGQFVGCLEGMAEACRALDFPVASGNVSLYNESKATGGGSAILPTPAIGGVGLLHDWEKSATISFKAEGLDIYVIGPTGRHLGRSLWLREIHHKSAGPPPPVDLEAELSIGTLVRELIATGQVNAVHDVSDGGLLVAIAEMALSGGIGATLDGLDGAAAAFGEDQGRYLVTAPPGLLDRLSPTIRRVGRTGGNSVAGVSLADLRAAHEGFFPKLMGSELTPEF